MTSLHDFHARNLAGQDVALADHAGQVVLVVNTASQCGLTPQLAGLEALHQRLGPEGLVILGFPCNQFGHQEPGDRETIAAGCVRNYGVTFPMFDKVEVKGPGAHPLFLWLASALPGWLGGAPIWNFTKFLLDRRGLPLRRFAPVTRPERLETPLRRALEA